MRLATHATVGLLSAVLGAAGCSSPNGALQGDEARRATVFERARLIVGDGSAPVDDASFMVEGGRITRVGRVDELKVPENAERVDLTGKTVMPALVDLHSHMGYEDVKTATESKDHYTRENLLDHLNRFAYTGHALTVSLGSDPPEPFIWAVRDESTRASFTGARFLTVGRGLAWPGTGPVELARNDTAYPIVSTWQARLAVRELAALNVPFVKLWLEDRGGYEVPADRSNRDALVEAHGVPRIGDPSQLTPSIYRAAIEEARQHGLRTLAHVKTREDLKDLIRAGIDGWTHPIADLPVDEELLGLLKERPHVFYIPVITPAGAGGSAPRLPGERPVWLTDPLLRAIKCPAFLEDWGQSFETRGRVPPPTGGLGVENVVAFHKAGVRIVLGSHDAGGNRVLGWGSHMEMEAFVNWVGMTPHEAIVASTSAAAQMLGVADLGSVAAGKSADFIVLDADPLDDIRNTRRISDVYLRGQRLDRPAMKATWNAACSALTTT